jgi:hypothetical protein
MEESNAEFDKVLPQNLSVVSTRHTEPRYETVPCLIDRFSCYVFLQNERPTSFSDPEGNNPHPFIYPLSGAVILSLAVSDSPRG